MVKSKLYRKNVEIGRKRIPLRKLLHGKTIRDAAKALEEFRLTFNEEEILLGATLTVKHSGYDEFTLVAHRPETDKEYNDRLEKERLAEEKRREAAQRKKERDEAKRRFEEENKKLKAIELIRELASKNGFTEEEITKLLKTNG